MISVNPKIGNPTTKGTNLAIILSLAFWAFIWFLGRHPDVTWGDGLGYALAIHRGFDWATNANSHFLYLNFHHLVLLVFPFSDAIQVLSWASLFWALSTLWLLGILARFISGPSAALISIHVFASCFTFWRHACIIEVYTFSSFFWALAFLSYWQWEKEKWPPAVFFIVHALGLLVHVQMVLLFPALLWKCWRVKKYFYPEFLLYLIPVLIVVVSVFYLKTNDLTSILLDNKASEMSSNLLPRILKGMAFIPAFSLFLWPTGFLLMVTVFRKSCLKNWFREGFRAFLSIVLVFNLMFCIAFPEPGIHVFLLPVFLVLSLFIGQSIPQKFPSFSWPYAFAIPGFSSLFYLVIYWVVVHFQLFPISEQTQWKGGPGYYLLPWANGNASSVLEKANEAKNRPSPSELDWNFKQAQQWENR